MRNIELLPQKGLTRQNARNIFKAFTGYVLIPLKDKRFSCIYENLKISRILLLFSNKQTTYNLVWLPISASISGRVEFHALVHKKNW